MTVLIKSQNLTSFEMIDELELDPNAKLSLYKQLHLDFCRKSEVENFKKMSLKDMELWSEKMSKSNMCPKHLVGKPIDIFMTLEMGYELGLKPIQAIKSIYIVNGVANTYGNGIIALIRSSGLCEYIKEWTDGKIKDGTFIAYCEMKRKGEPATIKSFSYEQAKQAKLLNKAGPWTDYPDQMIQRRATGKAGNAAFADVLWGLIDEVEGQDILDHEAERAKMARDITPLKKGNEGARQLLDIPDEPIAEKEELPQQSIEPEKPIEQEPLATEQELEQLRSLIETLGLITQQELWLKQAKVERLEDLKQKTVKAIILKYSNKED